MLEWLLDWCSRREARSDATLLESLILGFSADTEASESQRGTTEGGRDHRKDEVE
jgi:hypothetical protein